MKTALLVTDLEGVAGVDSIEALMSGGAGYPEACALLTAETSSAVRGLQAAGFERVRVCDSHRPGGPGPNLEAAALPEGVELRFENDAFSEELFEGVSAVACLGMHAAAGTRGFAAHTVTVHCGVFSGRRSLSEAELLLGLCAERKVPVVFASGDEALRAALLAKVRFVATKRSFSPHEAVSKKPERVRALLFEAARQAPLPAPGLPRGPWTLRFKSRWQSELAARHGARPAGECAVLIEGTGARERYRCALELIEVTLAALAPALREAPGEDPFREDAAALLARPLARRAAPEVLPRARRAAKAFLARSGGSEEWARADRALTLHMLEAHAPAFFRKARLARHLIEAVGALERLPASFPVGLDPGVGMARLDALYVLRERGLGAARPDPGQLRRYIDWVAAEFVPIGGWLLGELAQAIGVEARPKLSARPMRKASRADDLYWVTHLFLLETRYLRRPLPAGLLEAETEELLMASPWVEGQGMLDLAAEVAFCLQAVGEQRSPEHSALVRLLARSQRSDGSFADPAEEGLEPEVRARQQAHCTAAALLALAGCCG